MKKIFIYTILSLCIVCNVHAEFSLIHKTGMYDALQENGMQAVHTETQIMYAKPGEWVYLYRPERSSFISYVRWYNYDTDRAIPKTYSAEESPTGNVVTRIESVWAKDTAANNPKFKTYNDYGWFAYDYASDRVTTGDVSYIEMKYRMHNGNSIIRIACDESIWLDDFVWSSSNAVTEPTLSKRIIYEIHPASEIANIMEPCKDMDGTNDQFLEEYDMIAPTGRQLYIGPKHMIHTKKVVLKQYTYYARSNYYYINSQGNVTAAATTNNWKWYRNGVEDPNINLNSSSAQFAAVNNNTEDTVIYELKYNSATGVYFNVARFRIVYIDKNTVGPVVSLPAITKNMDKIYEQNFNFEQPNTTNFAFWTGHIDVDESSYGYYNKNLDGSPSKRKIRQGNITWSEYAITNRKEAWVDGGGTKPQIYQHVDGKENIADNAKHGYMLYVDGSQQPGLVFDLKVNTDLCPGSTMYFSVWLCDVSSEKSGSNGRSAPNMDFIATGVDENGIEHALTTFTTGEFGINAPADLSNGGWSTTNRMERAKWHQIMFPVQFTDETTYPSYRLQIKNKSTSSDGNDFAIDDIRIYVQKPAVNPIQASTYDCPSGIIDSVTSYLRVDYQAIDDQGSTFFYQWRDYNDEPVVMPYLNGNNGVNSAYGRIELPESEEAVIEAGDTCSSLISFDTKYYKTKVPIVKYIKEHVDASTERYVMYIAQPMTVRTNYTYTGYVAVRVEDLGSENECGTKADLLVAGGTRITIDGEALGDSVVSLCGNRSYTLDIVLTYIAQNPETEAIEEQATPCKADWLIGDSTYVNANSDIYKYSFSDIESAVVDYRSDDRLPLSTTIVNYLLKQNLLVLNSASTIMQPSVSSSYTAFPTPGSANNGMAVCLTPRFLYINSDIPVSNMVVIGGEDDDLPQAIADRPRVIRLSNANKVNGSFSFNTHIKGTGETYIVEKAELVSSTNPNWTELPNIELNASSANAELGEEDIITISGNGLQQLVAGYDYTFHVEFQNEDQGCARGFTYFTLRIIPDEVTWLGGNWNNDDSWSSFVPLEETNVILQPNQDYNVTFSSDENYDINFVSNDCNNIYLPNDASLAGQEELNIHGKAFIDIKEYAWKWALTSIPIQGVVTGDLFVNTNESSEPFVVAPINQTVNANADDRITWQVYNKEYDASKDKWKVASNSLVRPIVTGEAIMIGIDCDNDDIDPIIRLPKQDNMYRYYEKNKLTWMQENEYVSRDENYGKPAWNGNSDLELKEIYTNIYLLGNPTFGYINISQLVDDNSDKLTGRYYLEPTGATTIPKKDEMISFNRDINTDEYDVLLPPYRGILLEGKASSNTLSININSSIINQNGRNAPRRYNYNNDIATSVQNNNVYKLNVIYDILGRQYKNNINELPSGIYIIREGNNVRKVFVER